MVEKRGAGQCVGSIAAMGGTISFVMFGNTTMSTLRLWARPFASLCDRRTLKFLKWLGQSHATGLTMSPSASTPTVACKICRTASPLFGVVDFSKSCLENQGKRLSLTGVPIYYRRCSMCGFIFTSTFDSWTPEGFQQHIYNDDYVIVDPDYVEIRPTNNARFVADLFQASSAKIKLLDYGGGEGLFARRMR